jgi:hypothetical protein
MSETPEFDKLVKEMDEENCDYPECTRTFCLIRLLFDRDKPVSDD